MTDHKPPLLAKVLSTGLCLTAIAPVTRVMAGQPVERPNILVILGDDMAASELSCYGGQNIQTPHIDQLASEGLRMTNNYASCAMSVPIRASLYTGLYPARHGSYQNHKATYSNAKSITHYLSQLGYRVGRTGKDHPVNQPKVYAFEQVPGFTVNCTASHPPLATADGINEFIRRDDGQPFCLFVCSINSHMPWDAGDANEFDASKVVLPPNCVDNEKTRSAFTHYLAEIRLLDDEVGMVMETLKASGKDNNTLVIFLSEQGPQMPYGKWTCYRYGQASALIARYPGHVAAGSVSDALVQYEDIVPTLIEAAGGEPVATLDGVSQLGILYGSDKEQRQWAYGIHNNIPEGPAYPIRSIQDKRYKLIVNLAPETEYFESHMMVENGLNVWTSWVASAQTDARAQFLTERFVHRPAIEFYDLQEDPWELDNLADQPRYAERIAVMQQALAAWMDRQGDRGVLMDTDNPEDPTLKTPIPISSMDDIDKLMRDDLSGNYYLDTDITIPANTEWIPIGATSITDTDPQRFRGILDGRGHTISGVTITTGTAFKGLFGRIDHATIQNLRLTNVDINGAAPTGGLTGAMIGASTVERVVVSGRINSNTEAGGIAGRVARDATHTDYHAIHDCYVDAHITATNLSTNLDTPSCAGGLVGLVHSNNTVNGAVARLDIARCYVTGAITSSQTNHISGCAAGMVSFTDMNPNIRMSEVLVLADQITAATPNYFYSRRLAAAPGNAIEHMEKLYARDDIALDYLSDHGVGGAIPEEIITLLPDNAFRTELFYRNNLSWDFDNTWTIDGLHYPTLRTDGDTAVKNVTATSWQGTIKIMEGGLRISASSVFSVEVIAASGKNVYRNSAMKGTSFIPLRSGVYMLCIRTADYRQTYKIAI